MSSSRARAQRLALPVSAVLLTIGALAACSEQQPLTPLPDVPTALPRHTLQAFDCTAVVGQSVRCSTPGPVLGGVSAALIGGQDINIRLSSSNTSYDPVTEIFSFDVTVQNLMNEAIGTPDGTTPDPQGIQVFFTSTPSTTGGTGTVSVANADGADFFTGSNGGNPQPYFAYSEVLARNAVSGAKRWAFHVPETVTQFSFRVLIETDVQYLLVINEVLVNPGGTITDANGEWFEVYNAGTRAVEMMDLVIADSAASGRRPYHLIASSLVVPPGGYVVFGNTTNTTLNGGVPVDYAYGTWLSLANSLDALKIARVVGSDTLTLDRVQYSSAAISAKDGISRELRNPALDNTNMDGSNWADALESAVYGPGGRGTPKAQNSTYTP